MGRNQLNWKWEKVTKLMKKRKRTIRPAAFSGLLAAAVLSVSACGAAGNTSVKGGTIGAVKAAGEVETEGGETPGESAFTGQEAEKGSAAAESEQPGTVSGQSTVTRFSGIPVDTQKAEAVSIYYGSICYSYFSEDKAVIRKAADLFTGFSLEEVPNGQLDTDTTYQIYFSADTEQIAAINVDKNGMFYLPEDKKFYKVKDGVFHFDQLDKLYKDSMYADGFDENQCLIQ